MSKSWFYLGIISSLAILTSSCGGDDKKATTPAPAPAPAAATSPAPAPGAPATPTSTAAAPTPTNPATPATTTSAASIKPISPDVAAGLIPPTDAENWSRTVAKGRPDPFAVLALQPVEIAIENTAAQQAPATASSSITKKSGVDKPLPEIKISTKLPKTSTISATQKNTSSASTTESSQDRNEPEYLRGYQSISAISRSGVNKALPEITVKLRMNTQTETKKSQISVPTEIKGKSQIVTKQTETKKSQISVPTEIKSKSKIATKPEVVVAKPLQAMAIEISGMIDVAGKTQVIIKLPTESFSRYVEVGERIVNGKVLVKRVEGQNSLSPTVVLEEVGIEVSRKIGDKLAPTNPDSPLKP
jgi:hypothetical protein